MSFKAENTNQLSTTSVEGHANGSFHPENITLKHIGVFFVVVLLVVLYIFRHKLADFHDRYRLNRRLRYEGLNSEFQDDIERGLNSANFDVISANSGDSRSGLHEDKYIIEKMMKERKMSFDEARLELQRERFGENDIGDDGVPKDPRTVRFS